MLKKLKAWWFETCATLGYGVTAIAQDAKLMPHDQRFLTQLEAEAAYKVSLEESRTAMECINRLAAWKGPVGHA
jgi:hypothetical protein